MSIAAIRRAWLQGYGNGKTGKDFTEEMAKKTVGGRNLKPIVRTVIPYDVVLETTTAEELSEYQDITDVSDLGKTPETPETPEKKVLSFENENQPETIEKPKNTPEPLKVKKEEKKNLTENKIPF